MSSSPRAVRIVNHPAAKVHSVDGCLICCIDPRFWNPAEGQTISTIEAFRQKKGWTIVPLTEAGGIQVLASEDLKDALAKEHLLARIEQEIGLHRPGILGISVHRDCGKYGYFKAFDNDAKKENEKLYGDLAKAKQLLEEKFSMKARVEVYIFDAEGVEEIIF